MSLPARVGSRSLEAIRLRIWEATWRAETRSSTMGMVKGSAAARGRDFGAEGLGGGGAEDLGGDVEGGDAVLDDGDGERLGGVEVAEFGACGGGAAGGVVVVAEMLLAESGRAALVSGGVD